MTTPTRDLPRHKAAPMSLRGRHALAAAALLLLLQAGCGADVPTLDPLFPGKALTVQLQPDTTVIWLEDYVMDVSSIESIDAPEGLSYRLTDDSRLLIYGDMVLPLDFLGFRIAGNDYAIPLRRSELQSARIIFRPDAPRSAASSGAKGAMAQRQGDPGLAVRMKGEMNSWNPAMNPMAWDGEAYATDVWVKPGRYQYIFVVDGREVLDASNTDRIGNGMGGTNHLLTVPPASESPTPRLMSVATAGVAASGGAVTLEAAHADRIIALWENRPVETVENMAAADATSDGMQLRRTLTIPAEASRLERSHLRAWAIGPGGASRELVIPLANGRIVDDASQLTRHDPRSWRMYFILIDRFHDGNPANTRPLNIPEVHPKADYHGGDFAGITRKIRDGYFDMLGVNALWLSPVSRNPDGPYGRYPEPETQFSGYHGYWPVSSSQLDPRFGTDQEFRELISTAHEHGISVILDYVANHVHELHPVLASHPDWKTDLYLPDGTLNTERWDEHRLTTWFDVFMPTLDFSRPEVIETMTDSALFWVLNYDLDGFRHDATKHIQTEFWRTLTRKVKEQVTIPQDRMLYQVGETYGSRDLIASYIGTGLLDAQFDFALYDAGLAAFARGESMRNLRAELEQSFDAYGVHNTMGYISGNHDKPRFITLASGEVAFDEDAKYAGWTREIGFPTEAGYLKQALNLAFIFTIPGIPVLYQGDEFGMPGANDPDNRRMMLFQDDDLQPLELRQRRLTASLAKLRASSMALTYGDALFLHADDHTMAFRRSYFSEHAFALFNNSAEPKTVAIPMDIPLRSETPAWTSHAGHEAALTDGILSVTLPAFSFEIITLTSD